MKPDLKKMLAMMAIPLVVFIAFCLLPRDFGKENTIVSPRLVIFHPDTTKLHVELFSRGGWYQDVQDDGYFEPDPSVVKKIDAGLLDFLKQVSTEHAHADKHFFFSKGINAIRVLHKSWGGQFMGVVKKSGKQVLCSYSFMEDAHGFAELKHVPYVSDGNGRNFHFFYDVETGEHSGFHISGSDAGPFGADFLPEYLNIVPKTR